MDKMIEMARVWSTPSPSIKTRRVRSNTDIIKKIMEEITMKIMDRGREVFRILSETRGRVRRMSLASPSTTSPASSPTGTGGGVWTNCRWSRR